MLVTNNNHSSMIFICQQQILLNFNHNDDCEQSVKT